MCPRPQRAIGISPAQDRGRIGAGGYQVKHGRVLVIKGGNFDEDRPARDYPRGRTHERSNPSLVFVLEGRIYSE